MTDMPEDWLNDDREDDLDSGLVDLTDFKSAYNAQRIEEIKQLLQLMNIRFQSGGVNLALDPEFFLRKKELENELDNLYP